jgi:hypothetical protein
MKPGLQTIVDNVAKVAAGIATLSSTRVMVGVPAEKGARKDGSPISNAGLAYVHENGAPEAGIPARPFLKPGIEAKQSEITAALEKTGKAALDGNLAGADRGFNITGLIGQNAVRAKINEGVPPPLKPATLAARRARGRTGDKPLIDTGALRNSLTYVIRKV